MEKSTISSTEFENNLKKISHEDIRWETRRGNRMISIGEYILPYDSVSPLYLFRNDIESLLGSLVAYLTYIAEDLFTYGFSVKYIKVPDDNEVEKGVIYKIVLDWNITSCPSNFANYIARNRHPAYTTAEQYWKESYEKWDQITNYSKFLYELNPYKN